MTKTKYGVELSAATLRALERFGPGAASNSSQPAKQAPLPLSSAVLKVTPSLPMAALPKALAASPWANLPTLRAFDAAYLLAGIEPPMLSRSKHPPLVLNMLNLISDKTGAVRVKTMSEQRDTITQSEFRGLMAEYAVKPAPVMPAFKPQAVPMVTTEPQAVPIVKAPESKEQRQDRRLKACEDAGLVMPASSIGRLPDGVGRIADLEGVERQSFTPDVKAALKRREAITKPARVVRRT